MLLVGSIGKYNVGDDAILIAFLKRLETQSNSSYNAYIATKNDYLLKSLIGLKNVKADIAFGIQLLISFIKSRYVLLCGGDYLDDFGSLSYRLRSFILLFSIAFISKISKKNFLIINNGFRAKSHLGLSFERIILSLVNYVSVRDSSSYNLFYKYKAITKGFDTAVLWASVASEFNNSTNKPTCSLKKIGLSITPFFSNFFSNPAKDLQIAREFANSLDEIISNNPFIELTFFAFGTGKKTGDQNLIKRVTESLDSKNKDKFKIILYNGDIHRFLKEISQMDIMVCCKYHSILFSYILRKPMVVINYHPKNLALSNEIGLPSNAILSINDVLEGKLSFKISQLLDNPSTFKATLPLINAELRAIDGFPSFLRVVQTESP